MITIFLILLASVAVSWGILNHIDRKRLQKLVDDDWKVMRKMAEWIDEVPPAKDRGW